MEKKKIMEDFANELELIITVELFKVANQTDGDTFKALPRKEKEATAKKHLKELCETLADHLEPDLEITDHENFVEMVCAAESGVMMGVMIGDAKMSGHLVGSVVQKHFDRCLKVVRADVL